MKRLTKEQAVIITGYTGVMVLESFSDFHEDIERRLDRSVFTHELASKDLWKDIKSLYKEDFLSLIPKQETKTNDA